MNEPNDSRWYREPMMWLVVAIPLATVVAGFTTLWLASRNPDTIVADAGPQGPVVTGTGGAAAAR
ncbi:MAG: hypothetical protein U1F14_01770 [Steroidobacteraceae bacterium]